MNIVDAFEQIKDHLQGACLADVAEQCGVTSATLRNWRDHKVKYPQLRTFRRIAQHYGYELTMVRRGISYAQARARAGRHTVVGATRPVVHNKPTNFYVVAEQL